MSKGYAMNDPYGQTLRLFHYGMMLFVVVLALTGFSIYFREVFGIAYLKQPLVYLHAYTAYGFLVVLCLRLLGAVIYPTRLSISRAVPRLSDLSQLLHGIRDRRLRFAGRSPLSRIISGTLYLAFLLMALTGLIRAGTDLYHPPLGPLVKTYVSTDSTSVQTIKPFDRTGTDRVRYDRVMGAKVKVGQVHIYTGFAIVGLILLHGIGTLLKEWHTLSGKPRGLARLMLLGIPREKP